ncbi:MAG: hypothetical protein KME57_36285 [Scytonema hyalinum WJT4-NPBG1]|jgi:hypothetical protein|nr:hypothetical protein [Scytonema hyalinum WJT4-NPBG1]
MTLTSLINATGVATLGTVGAIATVAAAAISPIGAGLLIAGVLMWSKQNR